MQPTGSGDYATRLKALGDRLCAEREAARARGEAIPPVFPPLLPQPTDERTADVEETQDVQPDLFGGADA